MILVTPKSRDKFKSAKKTFGELKVGDKYWAYLKNNGSIKERTIEKIDSNNTQYQCIVEIGGSIVKDDYIKVYYDTRDEQFNVVHPGSSITIMTEPMLIYATTKEELEEAIKYYS